MSTITVDNIKTILANCYDVKYRQIFNGSEIITLIYIENLCDIKYISETIITPLVKMDSSLLNEIELINSNVIFSSSVEKVQNMDIAINKILSGNVIILASSYDYALSCGAQGYDKRDISIPSAETVIKGPREGFTEDINTNMASVRRRIKSPDLKVEQFIMGTESQTTLAMVYLEGKSPDRLVQYIRDKIDQVNNGCFIFYSNKLEESISCKHTSFDTVGYTEKPDVAVSKLSEGRVLLIMDGNSFVTTAPYFFIENFQTTDDYTLNKQVANLARIFRYMAFLISVFLPALYLALVTVNIKLIPSIFLFRMAVYRAGVPVPTIVELMYMLIFFQIIREAGVRLPQPIGPTLSIVGALILGDAAVSSGLASQVTVVVVALSSITSYLIPKIYISIFKWNLITILFTFILGLPGFFTALVLFIAHLSDLTTCGYPFLYPMGTRKYLKYKDVILRSDINEIQDSLISEGDDY